METAPAEVFRDGWARIALIREVTARIAGGARHKRRLSESNSPKAVDALEKAVNADGVRRRQRRGAQ